MGTATRILNLDQLELGPFGEGERFAARIGRISSELGAEQLGYNLTVIEPGRAAFPLHNHRKLEEAFFILEGQGELRLGDERHPLRAGDMIACPAGGPDTAHQIINTGVDELRMLAISTVVDAEVVEYPDSDKHLVYARFDGEPGVTVRKVFGPDGEECGYWDGEA